MKRHLNSFDFILETVSANHDLNAYLELLSRDGTLIQEAIYKLIQASYDSSLAHSFSLNDY